MLKKKTDRSFDLCNESGAADAFFGPDGGALTGEYEEVSCLEWQGTDSSTKEWDGACLAPDDAPLWPSVSCGNQGARLRFGMHHDAVLVYVNVRRGTPMKARPAK
jgi:hypothetical protein